MTDDVRRGQAGSSQEEPAEGPVIREKRRLDPQTGEVRNPAGSEGSSTVSNEPEPTADETAATPGAAEEPPVDVDVVDLEEQETTAPDSGFAGSVGDDLPPGVAHAGGPHPDTALAAERLSDLQRLQAEYVNYKRRVDRDRDVQRDATVMRVVESLLPVLDDIHLAREHGDLAGTPFEKIADKLDSTLSRHGLEQFGAVGDPFDPTHHEALMHIEAEVPEGSEGTTVVQVMQPGYRIGDRVVRPARVAVADPS